MSVRLADCRAATIQAWLYHRHTSQDSSPLLLRQNKAQFTKTDKPIVINAGCAFELFLTEVRVHVCYGQEICS